MTAAPPPNPRPTPGGRDLGGTARAVLVLVFIALAFVAAGCGADEAADDGALKASGVIVDVQADLTQVQQFDLVTDDGTRITFVPEAGALERSGFSPAHIREHSALVEPISVRYREEEGLNIVTGVGDADE